MLLWLFELLAATLGCAYLWELCDTLGRASWVRRIDTPELASLSYGPHPFVCFQVPCYNEPPDMVIATLESLRQIEYPNYEILVLDDNTDDETLWRPVEAWCIEHNAKFVHLEDWPGYKSGALNFALEHMVDDACELIGVIDSDYQIEPHFLRQCAPLFDDDQVGFIQAPQDYRDWQDAPFYRRLYYSYHYFFAVSQPSRNERDGAIFAGTMGLIRRRGARAGRRLGRVVHYRGRRAFHAVAARGLVRAPRRPLLRQGNHAADLRGIEGPALPLVLRRDPDPSTPLAFDAAGHQDR